MAEVESRLIALGLSLPPATPPPAGQRLPFDIPVAIEGEVELDAR